MENTEAVCRQRGTWPAEIVPTFSPNASTSGDTLSVAAARGGGPPCLAPGYRYLAWCLWNERG